MDKREEITQKSTKTKIIRIFSNEFKKSIIKDIETKKLSVLNVSRIYEVSETAVYKWLRKYSHKYQKGVRMVLEIESEGNRVEYLMKKLAEAQQSVGKKQIEIEFLNKVIELCSEELGYDIKKKLIMKQSSHIE